MPQAIRVTYAVLRHEYRAIDPRHLTIGTHDVLSMADANAFVDGMRATGNLVDYDIEELPPTMTRKDVTLIAKAFYHTEPSSGLATEWDAWFLTLTNLVTALRTAYPNFDAQRFMAASSRCAK